ncbi:Hypothetical_protein [Hexamita inflata]|uniref:Hypothetical_protein n=1 Tax=Hexamita inflata TaxID=28002 RepID=A0AA86UHQ4_9EUKA|nr:Hypothetical protein HINF_LOCUS28218 [Hexamita inflata]
MMQFYICLISSAISIITLIVHQLQNKQHNFQWSSHITQFLWSGGGAHAEELCVVRQVREEADEAHHSEFHSAEAGGGAEHERQDAAADRVAAHHLANGGVRGRALVFEEEELET